jgi:hypothetical protein
MLIIPFLYAFASKPAGRSVTVTLDIDRFVSSIFPPSLANIQENFNAPP